MRVLQQETLERVLVDSKKLTQNHPSLLKSTMIRYLLMQFLTLSRILAVFIQPRSIIICNLFQKFRKLINKLKNRTQIKAHQKFCLESKCINT